MDVEGCAIFRDMVPFCDMAVVNGQITSAGSVFVIMQHALDEIPDILLSCMSLFVIEVND